MQSTPKDPLRPGSDLPCSPLAGAAQIRVALACTTPTASSPDPVPPCLPPLAGSRPYQPAAPALLRSALTRSSLAAPLAPDPDPATRPAAPELPHPLRRIPTLLPDPAGSRPTAPREHTSPGPAAAQPPPACYPTSCARAPSTSASAETR